MGSKVVDRIKEMVTPKVTIESYQVTDSGVKADIKYTYSLCAMKDVKPTLFTKVFTVIANEDGDVYFYPGLFN